MSNTRRWATRKEAALYARTSVATLDRLITNGALTRHNLGRSVRIDLNELDAHITRNTSGKKAS